MKNIVIWGFDSESAIQAINMLKEKEIIEIKAWIGEAPECTHDMINLIVGNFKKESYQGYGHDMYHDVFYDSIYQFMDMMSRHSFYVERSFHDYLNIFNIYYDLFSTILIKNNVDAVLFSNLPHEGPDLILYKIAGKLNIKTVMFYQTIFPNKFFYLFENLKEVIKEFKFKYLHIHSTYINTCDGHSNGENIFNHVKQKTLVEGGFGMLD